jgi:hypothetical protein
LLGHSIVSKLPTIFLAFPISPSDIYSNEYLGFTTPQTYIPRILVGIMAKAVTLAVVEASRCISAEWGGQASGG